MADFSRLKTTLGYARLGLVSLSAATVPITATAQEICGTELFEGEPDAADLMNRTVEFLDVLQSNGVVAFQGSEGRITIDAARRSLQEGVGSATLLACVVDAEAIQFGEGADSVVVGCGALGSAPSIVQSDGSGAEAPSGQLFCTNEFAAISQYLGSEA